MKKLKIIILIFFLCIINIPTINAKIESFDIKYNVNDPEGRCGNPSTNNCASIAEVKYTNKTVTYYMQKQVDAEHQIVGGSCRIHALATVGNALNNTKYSTLDLQNYLKQNSKTDGNVYDSNFDTAFKFLNLEATRYHSDTSDNEIISLIADSFKKDLPVIIFVKGYNVCPDLANTNHALVLLGTDEDNHVVFVDSSTRYPGAKKRTIEELVKGCKVSQHVADSYCNIITFADTHSLTGGTTTDPYPNGYIEQPQTSNDFSCKTIFLNEDGSETEFKKILDQIFKFIQVLAPIIAIVFTIIDYYKALVSNTDIKKVNNRTLKRIIIAALIVFLPMILDLLFHLFGLYDLSTCNIGE